MVSGKCKGVALKAVPGLSTRPTTDKVKEAIFNIIGPYFDGGVCLDLFAGSGGLGIEALSRGAEKSIFVDRDGKAIHTIKENIRSCSLEEQTEVEVYRNDANRAIKAIIKRGIKLDYVFLDPPYKKQQLEALMKIIDEQSLLNVNGIVVCEHSSDIVIPNQIGNLSRVKEETYGITTISIYKNNPLT